MKTFIFTFSLFLTLQIPAHANTPAYVCNSQCVGIDYNEKLVYQVELKPTLDPKRGDAYADLQEKCTQKLKSFGANVPGLLIKALDYEGSNESESGYAAQGSALEIGNVGVINASATGWSHEKREMKVRVIFNHEKNACHFELNPETPEYDGALPIQG